ncbi:MAG: hypothetical protein RIS76_328 [Verrucomicrobiota bacterium]|jgi:hypothetical protein
MNAAAVIDEIKRLSDSDKREVFAFVAVELGVKEAEGEHGRSDSASHPNRSFAEARDRVFREHRELFRKLAQ